jgi:hypothetical protein
LIDKIYFITHPAFSLLEPEEPKEYSPHDLEIYFKNHLKNIIHNAQHDPSSLLVFIPSIVVTKRQLSVLGDEQDVVAIEQRWINYAKRQVKGRLFVPKIMTPLADSVVVADHLRRSMAAKGFDVKKANIVGYGTWLEACAAAYPKQFLIKLIGTKKLIRALDSRRPQKAIHEYWWREKGRLKIIETGSISIRDKKGFQPRPKPTNTTKRHSILK